MACDIRLVHFLNISPDHIGPNEHPTFEDYLAHKMMLFDHSDEVIINAESDHLNDILKHAKKHMTKYIRTVCLKTVVTTPIHLKKVLSTKAVLRFKKVILLRFQVAID